MIKTLLFTIFILTISGCSTYQPVAIDYKYIHNSPPAELYEIPPNVPDINIQNSTQKEVANWITNRYKRTLQLETQIIKLKEYDEISKKRAIEAGLLKE